jgi:D-amino-acid dehydrogenase
VKVIVLGGGVIGVSTAYYLALVGHEVVVVERRRGAGLETSFANAGEISPGYSAPWAAPGLPLKALKWLFMKHRPLVIRPLLDPAMMLWSLRLLRNCTAARYDLNKSRMLRLAEYSRDSLRMLRAKTGIAYDERTRGTLQLFRAQKQVDRASADVAILNRFGIRHELLDCNGCVQAEPALARVKDKIAGGLRLPEDETGDCFLFTSALAMTGQELGVTFRYETDVEKLLFSGGLIEGVQIRNSGRTETLAGDAYVVALASYSPRLLNPLGIHLPVYPVKGYSLTLPVIDANGAPESTVMDETYKVAVTRLGNRVRVGGTAELAGYDLTLRQARRETLEHVVTDLFVGACNISQGSFWAGLRPMTPDGPPIIGACPISNLFLNTGHGTLGWTMAAGSGRILADVVSGVIPDIDIAGLGLSR